MFRQWLSKQVCKHYGHHYWVRSGAALQEDGTDDGKVFHINVVVDYQECKRCGKHPNDPGRTVTRVFTINAPVLTGFSLKDGKLEYDIDQRINEVP